MTIEEEIKFVIERDFNPEHLEIMNESNKHAGHAGDNGTGQTHFQLLVVSKAFEGCNRMQRQQKVNDSLMFLFSKGLHAISMSLKTPGEFEI